jgi:DNA polymerase III delta prime subunit
MGSITYERWLEPIPWPQSAIQNPRIQEIWEKAVTLPPEVYPNFILYGPAGTGKTSCATSYLRHLFGTCRSQMVLFLNASDDRGAQSLRQQLTHFCSLCPVPGAFPLRFVVLDEADSLTQDAQEVLISAMDRFPQTRFMILCNFAERLDAQILSRSVSIPFPRVYEDTLETLLCVKCAHHGIAPPPTEVLSKFVERSGGDIRHCLQSLFTYFVTHRVPGIASNPFTPVASEDGSQDDES